MKVESNIIIESEDDADLRRMFIDAMNSKEAYPSKGVDSCLKQFAQALDVIAEKAFKQGREFQKRNPG